jgi:serine/threonine-protein kinase
MPPEQARGRSEHIDGRTDLWAVGSMMFRLIAGRYVHIADTQNEVLLLAMTEHAKSIAEVMPTIHPKVAAVIDHALQYEPLDRFQDADEMRQAVKEALAALEAQDAKATLARPISVDSVNRVHDDDDIDDAAATIPVSDFVKAKTQSSSSPDESKPRSALWVHTKATPPEPPKPPKKKRPIVPILAASAALAALCVGLAYGLPHFRGDSSHPSASASASGSASALVNTAPVEDVDASDDDGGDDYELDDEDAASPATSATSTKLAATTHPTTAPNKTKKKKKKHR